MNQTAPRLHPQLIVFDWDGTLMDSTAHIVSSVQAAARAMGWPAPDEDRVRSVIGLSLERALATVMPEGSREDAQAFAAAYREHYLDSHQKEGELFPGVEGMLQRLEARGIWMAVATGKGRAGLDRVLARTGIGEHFLTTRCADEARSKPHPQMLEDILDYTGLSPQEGLMVGDSAFDLDMATCLGMPAVAVTGGAHSRERLLQSRPNLVLERVTELEAWLTV